MPRVTRRLRKRFRDELTPGSSRWMRLMLNIQLKNPKTPLDPAEDRRAWELNRDRLMRECRPGQRPAAYYRFDLGIEVPPRWFDEIQVLFDRRLIDEEEAAALERAFPDLLTGTVPFSGFEGLPAHVHHLIAGHAGDGIARELEMAAAWHAWRGRPEQAAIHQARAADVRKFRRTVPRE